MLKFRSYRDLHPRLDMGKYLNAGYIPTVDDFDEALAPMYADTVLQILKGQGLYFGYEIERDVDNEIKIPVKSRQSRHLDRCQMKRQIAFNMSSELNITWFQAYDILTRLGYRL